MSTVASKSIPMLSGAIKAYVNEHGGAGDHQPMAEQLTKVIAEIHGKHTGGDVSPGKQRAIDAAKNAMPAEKGHSPGAGNTESNLPGKADLPDKVADIAGPNGRDDRMHDVAAVPSGGAIVSVRPAGAPGPGTMDIRRIAAAREASRPDSKMKADTKTGDDNTRSNPAGPAAPSSGLTGDVKMPAPVGGSDTEAIKAGAAAMKPDETPPARVGQPDDPWAAAAMKAKQMMGAANKKKAA